MKTSDFDYELDPQAIAQHPAEPRDAARLLVHARATSTTEHRLVRELPEILRANDLLVVNDTRVRPARLFGKRASGGFVEVLLLERQGSADTAALTRSPDGIGADRRTDTAGSTRSREKTGPDRWHALVRPAKRLHPGDEIELEGGAVRARAVARILGEDGRPGPEWVFDLEPAPRFASLDAALETAGRMPLPPYIQRERGLDPAAAQDREDYQTVFAARTGAVAAPTAGLHFTRELLERLRARGIDTATVTLHVGAGTFQPVQTEDIAQHRMHTEEFTLPQATVDAIDATRARGGRVVAVGTTTTRVLESCADGDGRLQARSGSTRIFIHPGWRFRSIDALLTNFHLPKSTLLMLVSAFAGRERTLDLYAQALRAGYRFYSYGDAMLLI